MPKDAYVICQRELIKHRLRKKLCISTRSAFKNSRPILVSRPIAMVEYGKKKDGVTKKKPPPLSCSSEESLNEKLDTWTTDFLEKTLVESDLEEFPKSDHRRKPESRQPGDPAHKNIVLNMISPSFMYLFIFFFQERNEEQQISSDVTYPVFLQKVRNRKSVSKSPTYRKS